MFFLSSLRLIFYTHPCFHLYHLTKPFRVPGILMSFILSFVFQFYICLCYFLLFLFSYTVNFIFLIVDCSNIYRVYSSLLSTSSLFSVLYIFNIFFFIFVSSAMCNSPFYIHFFCSVLLIRFLSFLRRAPCLSP